MHGIQFVVGVSFSHTRADDVTYPESNNLRPNSLTNAWADNLADAWADESDELADNKSNEKSNTRADLVSNIAHGSTLPFPHGIANPSTDRKPNKPYPNAEYFADDPDANSKSDIPDECANQSTNPCAHILPDPGRCHQPMEWWRVGLHAILASGDGWCNPMM